MSAFLTLGSLMALVALAWVLVPLLKRTPRGRRLATAILAVALIPGLAAALYTTLSDGPWHATPAPAAQSQFPPQVLQMVASLENKLKANPDNLDGWLMLGRSYFQLSEYTRAVEAYQRAYHLSGGAHPQAVIGLGEALLLADPQAGVAPAAELFEQAIAYAPRDPKVLWYSGLVAYHGGQWARARERWAVLLELGPPPPVAGLLQEKLDEIDAHLTSSERNARQAE